MTKDVLLEKCKQLKEEILQEEVCKEYLKNKKLFTESEEINNLKKEIVRSKNENRMDDHKKLLNEYNSHPLVNNYLTSKENFRLLLLEIKNMLD